MSPFVNKCVGIVETTVPLQICDLEIIEKSKALALWPGLSSIYYCEESSTRPGPNRMVHCLGAAT